MLCLLVLLCPHFYARAADKPKTVLILVSGATLGDLQPGGKLSSVGKLAGQGGIALLHNGVYGTYNTNAAYLSVGAGERMAAPATGAWSPESLRRFQPPVANRAAKVGALGDALTRAGATLDGMDNALPNPVLIGGGSAGSPDVRVIVYTDLRDANEHAHRLLYGDRVSNKTWYIAAPDTPEVSHGAPYRRLGFLVAFGKGITPGSLLSSPTTRTPGLVANVDIAPTIAARYGAVIPGAAGQPVRTEPSANVWRTLTALDREHTAAARATALVLGGYGVFAGLACLFAIGAAGRESAWGRGAARFGLLTAASVLPALLAVGVLAPQSAVLYGAALTVVAVAIAGLATLIAGRLRPAKSVDALTLVFALLIVAVCADLFLHTRFVESSLLSGATLTGIRFYGIGNEWLGLLVGAAVAIRAPWYVGVVVVCAVGLPFFGTDAGGTLAATVAFALLHFSKKANTLKTRHVAGAFALAVAVTLGFALLDRWLPSGARSHVGAAVATGGGADGFAAIAEIVTRKLALNAGLLRRLWTWVALAAIGAVGWGLTKRLPATGETRSVLPAALCGAVVALLFNDGGIAAGLLLLVPVMVRWLYGD